MPFDRLVLLALLAGLCDGQALRALRVRRWPLEKVQNFSAIAYGTGAASNTIVSNSLFGTSSHSSVPPLFPTGHITSMNSSTSHGPNSTALPPHLSSNETCGSPTLNVLGASLDWWYTSTVHNPVSTFSIQFNSNDSSTGWTLLPTTTPFNLDWALGSPAPIAAKTTVITQTAYTTPNATTGTGQIPNVIVTPPPAAITIPNYPTAFSEGTPFVYFSSYEIVSKIKTSSSYGDGNVGCAAVTTTVSLEAPFAFPYTGTIGNASNSTGAGVTGDVNPAFLGIVGQSAVIAGSWVATPTVAIVVQDIFVAVAVLAASTEESQKSLMIPTATLPSFLSQVHPKTTEDHHTKPNTKGHTETTATFLLVPTPTPLEPKDSNGAAAKHPKTTNAAQHHIVRPFVAIIEHSETTLQLAVNPTERVVTTEFRGDTITATRIPQGDNPTRDNGGTTGGLVSEMVSPLKETPTNALQVLSQAEESLRNNNPTTPASPIRGVKHHHKGTGSSKPVPIIIVGGTTFTANSQAHFGLPGSKTLTPGGTAVIAGTTLSLLPGGSSVVVNGNTQAVSTAVITPAPVLTIGGQVYHASRGSTYIIEGQTLTPGGIVSVHGTSVSLGPGLSSMVINGKTQKLEGPNNAPSSITSPPTLTIGGRSFAAINSGPTYVINGETLTPGEEETVSIHGKTYIVSLAAGATILKIETVGSNGEVRTTMYETFYHGVGGVSTVTSTVGVAGPSAPSKTGPTQSNGPAPNLQNRAASFMIQFGAIGLTFGSLLLATWL